MIRERVFDLKNNNVQEVYYDDEGRPASSADFEKASREATGYICPSCGKATFGKFEPFAERGIIAWCSNCGHMHIDKVKFEAWQAQARARGELLICPEEEEQKPASSRNAW